MFKPQSNIKHMNNKNRQLAAKLIFKPIKNWEDLYEITNEGKVYSIRKGTYLKPRLSLDGYERVTLCRDGKRYEMRVHRLVSETFLENKEQSSEVNHKDFNKCNNFVNNLEWCTGSQNVQHAINNNRKGFGNQINNRDSDGRFKTVKAYTFTNIYNNKSFTIIGFKNIIKQFGCSLQLVTQILYKYANTGCYIKKGYFKNLKIDTEYLKVQRLVNFDVDSSESKRGTSLQEEDIV